jgi:hypothetical protein
MTRLLEALPPVGEVFCDKLAVSSPEADSRDVDREVAGLFSSMGFVRNYKGNLVCPELWGRATVRFHTRSERRLLEVSGMALGALRAHGELHHLLGTLGSVPHKVTALDASVDLATPTTPMAEGLLARATAGTLFLGRKRCRPYTFGSLDADGEFNLNLGLNKRTARTSVMVYNKVLEFWDRYQVRVPGPRTRVEVRHDRHIGATLRDAAEPSALFYHSMAPQVLEAPPGVPVWSSHAEGYYMPPIPPADPMARLLGRLDGPEYGDLVRQALAVPGGVEAVCIRLRSMAAHMGSGLGAEG